MFKALSNEYLTNPAKYMRNGVWTRDLVMLVRFSNQLSYEASIRLDLRVLGRIMSIVLTWLGSSDKEKNKTGRIATLMNVLTT